MRWNRAAGVVLVAAMALLSAACEEDAADTGVKTAQAGADAPAESTTTTEAPTTTTTTAPATTTTTAPPTTTTAAKAVTATTAKPATTTTAKPKAASSCHPSYQGTCIPPDVSDADCYPGSGNGPWYVHENNIRVVGDDVFGLDGNDNDGIGCEA